MVLGGATTLRWQAAAGFTCVSSGGWAGSRSGVGSTSTARLIAATTYVLDCVRAGVRVRRSVTVAIEAPTVTLNLSQTAISENEPVTLRWSSRSATACVAAGGWTGARPSSGSEVVVGTRDPRTFTLTCRGSAARRATANARLLVHPVASLTSSAARVRSGSTVDLRWRATADSTCVASGSDPLFRGTLPAVGSRTSSPVTTTETFNLRCTNALGSALTSVSVAPGIRRVRWRAPARATDGRALARIHGYRVHAGSTPGALVRVADVPGTATSADLSLGSGDWHVSVSVLATVRTETGALVVRESELSRPFLRFTIR